MDVYIVRHGQTIGNEKSLHQNSEDPLTKTGHIQAQELAERLKNIDIDRIFCSPFERTKETLEHIKKYKKDIPVEYDERIVESKRPTQIEGLSTKDPKAIKIRKKIQEKAHDPEWYHSDEEKVADIMNRVMSFIKDLEKRGDESILIVTHGEILRTLFLLFYKGDNATIEDWEHFRHFFWITNTSITLVRYIRPEENPEYNGWKMITWNDHAHLGEI